GLTAIGRLLATIYLSGGLSQRFGSLAGLTSGTGSALPQPIRGFAGIASSFCQLRRIAFARQPLPSACLLLGLAGQLPLRAAGAGHRCAAALGCRRRRSTAATGCLTQPLSHVLGHALKAFVLLLGAACKFAQTLARFIHLSDCVGCRIAGFALNGLVLIAHLIPLQLEEVRQVLWLATATAATSASHIPFDNAVTSLGPV